jgi:hypothetical protein
MWTEELYGDLKGHGFDLEATHLDDADRIARLVLAVCINFVWCNRSQGEYKETSNAIQK